MKELLNALLNVECCNHWSSCCQEYTIHYMAPFSVFESSVIGENNIHIMKAISTSIAASRWCSRFGIPTDHIARLIDDIYEAFFGKMICHCIRYDHKSLNEQSVYEYIVLRWIAEYDLVDRPEQYTWCHFRETCGGSAKCLYHHDDTPDNEVFRKLRSNKTLCMSTTCGPRKPCSKLIHGFRITNMIERILTAREPEEEIRVAAVINHRAEKKDIAKVDIDQADDAILARLFSLNSKT